MNENLDKKRHGCVSAWLWLVVVLNVLLCINCIILMFDKQIGGNLALGLLSVFSLVNVLGAILLMRWNKIGFYIMCVNFIATFIVNTFMLNVGIGSSLFSFISILIWYGILHIKKNGNTAWSLMDSGWDYKHCRHLYQFFIFIAIILLLISVLTPSEVINPVSENDEEKEPNLVEVPNVKEITWKKFSDDAKFCVIEAPDYYNELKLDEDQILGLASDDSEPAIVILKESSETINSLGIKSSKKYAEVLNNMTRKDAGNSFKIISSEPYGDNSYLIVYEMTLEGSKFRYNLLTTHTKNNFYSCQVFCLTDYLDKVQPKISHILSSFEAVK